MAKRIVAIILAAIMCVAFASCSSDGAPSGMKLSSREGEPFKLYVPKEWKENVSSGISGAYYSTADTAGASARYYTPEDAEMTLDQYVAHTVEDLAATLVVFNLLENTAAVLGGADAKVLVYTASIEGKTYKYRQYITKHAGDFIMLTLYCPADYADAHKDHFDMIASEFVLCEKTAPVNDEVVDKKTPEGMKIASSDKVEYRFYVPKSWVCNSESGVSEAHFPESGKPNVTVISHSPDYAMTAQQYFESCEAQYKAQISGYSLISTQNRRVADRDAISYTYTAVWGEVRMRIMQTVFVYNDMIYSMTYTALEDSFDAHLGDVEKMLSAFRFR